MPELAVSFEATTSEEFVTVALERGRIEMDTPVSSNVPTCSLRLVDPGMVRSLCSNDVRGLLEGVVDGTCVLQGQIEPFIWFIARMAELAQTRRSHPVTVNEQASSSEVMD